MIGDTYKPGELFVYMNGDHWELGEVKRAEYAALREIFKALLGVEESEDA